MNDTAYPDFGILLVDDEPDWLGSLALTLESCAGISNITTCSDSRQVLPLLAEGGIRLVLLDLTMPHQSGEDLLAQIAEQHPEIVAIVVSGLNQLETAVRCMKLGAFDYCVKTDEADRIVGAVLRAVRMVEMRREYQEMSSRLVSRELRHPEGPEAVRGKGLSSALARTAFEWARENHKKVDVICPTVAGYVKTHPEYSDLILK